MRRSLKRPSQPQIDRLIQSARRVSDYFAQVLDAPHLDEEERAMLCSLEASLSPFTRYIRSFAESEEPQLT